MPCSDGRPTFESEKARFCCEVLSRMEENGEPIPDYIKAWWKGHIEYDRAHGRVHKHIGG